MFELLKSSIVQGITEALPVSSSMHLDLIGAKNKIALHVVTGLVGFFYLWRKGLLVLEIKTAYEMVKKYLNKSTGIRSVNRVWLFRSALLLCWALAGSQAFLNGILNSLLILYCEKYVDHSSEHDRITSSKIINASVICNILAIIPGVSRLGTVYAGLRFVGLDPKQSFRLSMIQGFFISGAGLIFQLGTFTRLSVYLKEPRFVLPLLLCAVLYYLIINVLLELDSQRIKSVVQWSCAYRLVLCGLFLLKRII